MLNLDVSLKLTTKQIEIKRAIVSALKAKIHPKLEKSKLVLDMELQSLFHDAMTNSAEYKSMKGERNINGNESLMGHFGFPPGDTKVDAIIDKWTANIHSEIIYGPATTKLNIGLKVYTINRTFMDVLGMAEAVQDTKKPGKAGLLSGSSANSHLVTWLKNLLLDGDRMIIQDYRVDFDPKSLLTSRSGQALMIKKGRWGVPSIFAGDVSDNWVLRVLEADIIPKIPGLIEDTVRRLL